MKYFTLYYKLTCFIGWLLLGVGLVAHIISPDSLLGFLFGAAAGGIGLGGAAIAAWERKDVDTVFLWGISIMGLFCATYPTIDAWLKAAAISTVIVLGVYATKRFNMLDFPEIQEEALEAQVKKLDADGSVVIQEESVDVLIGEDGVADAQREAAEEDFNPQSRIVEYHLSGKDKKVQLG